MASDYLLLRKIIPYISEYELDGNKPDIHEFSIWLNNKILKTQNLENLRKFKKYSLVDNLNSADNLEVNISRDLVSLYKYAKNYTKKVLQDTLLTSVDEFGFLATLMASQQISKSELIEMNQTEITTGMDIIKRLIEYKLIAEFRDKQDKRCKYVKISESGKQLMLQIFNEMNKAAHIISGNLNEYEKMQLLFLLEKLKKFHEIIHSEDRKSDIQTIFDQYL